MIDFTDLEEEQVIGNNQIDLLSDYGLRCAVTDFSALLGADSVNGVYTNDDEFIGEWWLKTPNLNYAKYIFIDSVSNAKVTTRKAGVRPVTNYSSIVSNITKEEIGKKVFLKWNLVNIHKL